MKLNEAEMRMAYQIESTNQASALNEIYMTWRYSQNQATKDTAESLLKKLRPLSDKECMDVIRERVCNPNGQLGAIEYAILEQPRPPEPGRENPVQANPVLDSPVLGKPEQENPAQLNTKELWGRTPPMSAISRNTCWRRCIMRLARSAIAILPWCSTICTGQIGAPAKSETLW